MKRARPQCLPSVTFENYTHCGEIYVTITTDDAGLPFEIFVRFGKAGHCGAAIFDAMTKILSYALRSGMDPQQAVKAMAGIGCSYGRRTCMNAVSEALRDVLDQGSSEKVPLYSRTERSGVTAAALGDLLPRVVNLINA